MGSILVLDCGSGGFWLHELPTWDIGGLDPRGYSSCVLSVVQEEVKQ